MGTPLLRDGILQGTPFDGMSYELTRLTYDEVQKANRILEKSRAGQRLDSNELRDLMALRKAAKAGSKPPAAKASTIERLSATVRELREVLK
ncbi:hypothetical protein [Rhodobacteraceae bacterium DSL-40]|uniref:hypothetical protein n=1 Tax=Amaricoccus sp. B4 TaxID=3368557 RepID=UPI0013A6D88C